MTVTLTARGVRSGVVSQGDLFRAEATGAVIVAAALLFRPRRYAAALAFLVAAGGTAAVAALLLLGLLHAEARETSDATAGSSGRPAVRAHG